MDALPDILRCDEHEPRDFRDEETVKQFVRPIRWLSINVGERRLLRLNVRLTPSKRFGRVVLHAFERAFPSIASRRPRGVVFRRADPYGISRSAADVDEIPFPRTSRRSGRKRPGPAERSLNEKKNGRFARGNRASDAARQRAASGTSSTLVSSQQTPVRSPPGSASRRRH